MSRLKQRGIVEYARTHIRIMNLPGLEAEACECYLVLRDHLNNYLHFDTGFSV